MHSTGEPRFTRYRLVRRLGAGGMGEVYLAEDLQLERSVALKIMSADLAQDLVQRRRFHSEAKAASRLAHPGVCAIHEVGETEDGRPFLAMEYVEGQTLEQLMQTRRLRIRETLAIGVAVAEALEAAHVVGIVHRDIKPGNIMLEKRGHVKVLDFGLAKSFGEDELTAATTGAQTRTGMLVGTPYYMSPEQVLGRALDNRSDVFSLGTVLYEAIVGQKPFRGQTVGETVNAVVNATPEPLGLENPVFSPRLDEIIFKCLEKEPASRYPSAKLLAQDLEELRLKAERASAASAATTTSESVRSQDAAVVGVSENAQRAAKTSLTKVRWLAAAALVVLLASVAGILWSSRSGLGMTGQSGAAAPQEKSVAVLPFENFTNDPDSEYLSDGLTEEITSSLSRLHGLKVAARNSAYSFKGKRTDVREIAKALHVSTVLEGSIRKAGDKLRVTAQLVNAADGYQLWSEAYDRTWGADILEIQEEIASRIAERLQGVRPTEQMARRAINPEAHKLYLQGRIAWNKRTESALREAVRLFSQAIEKEPTYGDAHAGLAATYLVIPVYSPVKPAQYRALARAAANRALEIDPNQAEARVVIAELQALANDDAGAEANYLKALELAPSDATAHHWYGRYLEGRGRREEGLKELRKAGELDTQSAIIQTTIPEWYYINGDYKRAEDEARRVVELFPDFVQARVMLAAIQLMEGDYNAVIATVDEARTKSDEPLSCLELKGFALARLHREAEARKILEDLQQHHGERVIDGQLAFIYMGLREYDKAFDLIEKQADAIDRMILIDPLMAELRTHPRFPALLEKAGLKPEVLGVKG